MTRTCLCHRQQQAQAWLVPTHEKEAGTYVLPRKQERSMGFPILHLRGRSMSLFNRDRATLMASSVLSTGPGRATRDKRCNGYVASIHPNAPSKKCTTYNSSAQASGRLVIDHGGPLPHLVLHEGNKRAHHHRHGPSVPGVLGDCYKRGGWIPGNTTDHKTLSLTRVTINIINIINTSI